MSPSTVVSVTLARFTAPSPGRAFHVTWACPVGQLRSGSGSRPEPAHLAAYPDRGADGLVRTTAVRGGGAWLQRVGSCRPRRCAGDDGGRRHPRRHRDRGPGPDHGRAAAPPTTHRRPRRPPQAPVAPGALPADLTARDGGLVLLQFSSAFCSSCRDTRGVLDDVAADLPGLVHRDVDLATRPELVRLLGLHRHPDDPARRRARAGAAPGERRAPAGGPGQGDRAAPAACVNNPRETDDHGRPVSVAWRAWTRA